MEGHAGALAVSSAEESARARVIELLKACENAVRCGSDRVVVIKRWRRSPRNWDRARVLPGVFGKIIGSGKEGYFVSVPVDGLVRALERVMGVAA